MKRMLFPGLVVPALLGSAPLPSALASDPEFGSYWHDGQAEVAGYRWTGTRYGQERRGHSVMIYVTEPFSEKRRVKVDDPARNPGDTVDVLKLNLIRDFQTGIYDYNTMVSLFVRSATFEPVKLTFSSAEWCGHVYDEMLFGKDGIRETLSSYFEGESGSRSYDLRPQGVSEDNLFILLRGLRGPYLAPGERREVPFLPGMFHRRLTHGEGAWTTATIERRPEPRETTVPAGTFSTIEYRVATADGREGRFHVDEAYPHRIVRWSWAGERPDGGQRDAGESGELTGFARLRYWELHDNGHERYLEGLGLSPLP